MTYLRSGLTLSGLLLLANFAGSQGPRGGRPAANVPRPSPSMSAARPAMQRPAAPIQRPGGFVPQARPAAPAMPAQRPHIQSPNLGIQRPNIQSPNLGVNRPAGGFVPQPRPAIPNTRPNINVPNTGNAVARPLPANIGNTINRPGAGNATTLPAFGGNGNTINRPGGGNTINRPGAGGIWGNGSNNTVINRPGAGNATTLPAFGGNGNTINRPGGGNTINRPGAGGIWGNGSNNTVVNRPGGTNNFVNRPGGNFNSGNVNNNININNNFHQNYGNILVSRPNYRPGYFDHGGYLPSYYGSYGQRPWFGGHWGWNSYPSWWGSFGGGFAAGVLTGAIASNYTFFNPFYLPVPNVAYSYAQPLIVEVQAPAPPPTVIVQQVAPAPALPTLSEVPQVVQKPAEDDKGKQTVALFETAQGAFKANDYGRALTEVDKALKLNPQDRVLHEFRALTLFAQQRYKDSATVLYSLLASGPGWNWDTVNALYPDPATYTNQLRTLEAHTKANPGITEDLFVLAYQYLVLGENDAAVKALTQFRAILPNDELSKQLLDALTKKPEGQPDTRPKPGG